MSLESLKKQAGRLASYLGAKHRVNLKHTSALEAVAALHGARNWQTLAASAATAPEELEQPGTPNAFRKLALSWDTRGQVHVAMPQRDWLQHGIAFGDTAYAWVQDNLFEAAQAGLPSLLLAYPVELAGIPTEVTEADPLNIVTPDQLEALAAVGPRMMSVVPVTAQKGWTKSLVAGIKARRDQENREILVLGLPNLSTLTEVELEDLLPIAQQGRSLGIVLRCYADNKADVERQRQSSTLLAQMTHQLFLGSAKEAMHEQVLQRLREAPAIYMSNNLTQF